MSKSHDIPILEGESGLTHFRNRLRKGWEGSWAVAQALVNYWPKSDPSRITFVTASDFSHEKSLIQLLRSISNHRNRADVIVFDLGLTEIARQGLEEFPNLRVFDYPFSRYPSWMRLENLSGAYAWKPICLSLALGALRQEQKVPDILIWLDAGSMLTTRLPVVEALASRHGVFGNAAKGSIQEWTVPEALKSFEHLEEITLNPETLLQSQISAALLAFDLRKAWVLDCLSCWSQLATKEDAIAPQGADKSNHRFDQSLISLILLTRHHPEFRLPSWPQALLGFKIHQDVD